MTEPQAKPELTKDEVADMISNALFQEKYNSKPTGLEGELAELDEIMRQVEMYTPLIEAYGPKLIEKCGPATRSVMAAMFKEMMPVLIPVIRKESSVMAKELVGEYFRQLHAYNQEQIKNLPEILEAVLKGIRNTESLADITKGINSIK